MALTTFRTHSSSSSSTTSSSKFKSTKKNKNFTSSIQVADGDEPCYGITDSGLELTTHGDLVGKKKPLTINSNGGRYWCNSTEAALLYQNGTSKLIVKGQDKIFVPLSAEDASKSFTLPPQGVADDLAKGYEQPNQGKFFGLRSEDSIVTRGVISTYGGLMKTYGISPIISYTGPTEFKKVPRKIFLALEREAMKRDPKMIMEYKEVVKNPSSANGLLSEIHPLMENAGSAFENFINDENVMGTSMLYVDKYNTGHFFIPKNKLRGNCVLDPEIEGLEITKLSTRFKTIECNGVEFLCVSSPIFRRPNEEKFKAKPNANLSFSAVGITCCDGVAMSLASLKNRTFVLNSAMFSNVHYSYLKSDKIDKVKVQAEVTNVSVSILMKPRVDMARCLCDEIGVEYVETASSDIDDDLMDIIGGVSEFSMTSSPTATDLAQVY